MKLKYVQEVVFDKYNTRWVMRNEPDRYSYHDENEITIKESTIEKFSVNPRVIIAKIPQKQLDRAKAEKIAQDMLYKLLAEEEGL
jgi:predicted ABC-type transport system involved in lysophospholipase L1 biosynthesis ATPase subunit